MQNEDTIGQIKRETEAISECIKEYETGNIGFITTALIHSENCASLLRMVVKSIDLGGISAITTDNSSLDVSDQTRISDSSMVASSTIDKTARDYVMKEAEKYHAKQETIAVFAFLILAADGLPLAITSACISRASTVVNSFAALTSYISSSEYGVPSGCLHRVGSAIA